MRSLANSCWTMRPCWTRLIGITSSTKHGADPGMWGRSALAEGPPKGPHQGETQNQQGQDAKDEEESEPGDQKAVFRRQIEEPWTDAKDEEDEKDNGCP